MLKYKIDVLQALKNKGYNTTRIRKENVFAQSTLTDLKAGVVVRPPVLDRLCKILQCQPGDLIEWVPDETV